jgi:ADP-L-glycero-D-manno-heptose 6-epimerase
VWKLTSKSTVIVTGAAGFIGSALLCALNGREISSISIVDRLDHTEKWKNLNALRYDDYFSADDFAQLVADEPDAFPSAKNHLSPWRVLVDHRNGCGISDAGLRDDVDLNTLRPLNMDAYSKHRFDLYARDRGLLDRITGVKYFNIFGPNEGHKGDMRSLVDPKSMHSPLIPSSC